MRDGDDWVLNGTKMFITNGVHADLYFVAAKTGSARQREMSMFIVEKGTPGFTVGRALEEDRLAFVRHRRAACSTTCRIPAANLLGEEGKGFYSVMKNFQTERIALAAMAVGHCHAGAATDARLRARSARPSARRCGTSRSIRQRLAMLDAKTRAARAVHVPLRLARRRRGTTSCRRSRC